MTITPAYQRDYRSAKAAKIDFHNNLDFIVTDFFNPYDGKPVNKSDLIATGETSVMIRYNRLTKITRVQL